MFLGTDLLEIVREVPCLSKSPNFENIYKVRVAHQIGWVVCTCIYGCLAIPDRRGRQPTSFL